MNILSDTTTFHLGGGTRCSSQCTMKKIRMTGTVHIRWYLLFCYLDWVRRLWATGRGTTGWEFDLSFLRRVRRQHGLQSCTMDPFISWKITRTLNLCNLSVLVHVFGKHLPVLIRFFLMEVEQPTTIESS
jgi:hypothetical protein